MGVVTLTLPAEADDFDLYLNDLLIDVIGDNRSRKYNFPGDTTALKTIIESVTNVDIDNATLQAANRLLRVEAMVQQRIEQLEQEVQKGILLQALVDYNDTKIFIIIKAEHLDFINENDNRKAKGLPIKRKIFKSFCGYLDESLQPVYSMVSDSKKAISTYWWSGFLELVEEHSDSYNTQTAFDAFDNKIFNKIKKKYPEDYMYLRNSTIQYFRSKDEFVMEDYVTEIIHNYIPENNELDILALEQNILRLPDTANFDRRFNIKREELKKRMIYKLKLTPQLVLEIKENIDWDSTVLAFEQNGIKYIQIRTEEGYKYFKKHN